VYGALTRSVESGFFVAFAEGGRGGREPYRKLLQAPEADRVIARSL
jgi:hypothetical protein